MVDRRIGELQAQRARIRGLQSLRCWIACEAAHRFIFSDDRIIEEIGRKLPTMWHPHQRIPCNHGGGLRPYESSRHGCGISRERRTSSRRLPFRQIDGDGGFVTVGMWWMCSPPRLRAARAIEAAFRCVRDGLTETAARKPSRWSRLVPPHSPAYPIADNW